MALFTARVQRCSNCILHDCVQTGWLHKLPCAISVSRVSASPTFLHKHHRDLHRLGSGLRALARPGPEAGPKPGGSDNVWVRAGFRPGSNDSNQTIHRTFRALSGHSFFRKEKIIRSCAHLMLVTQSGSANKSHRLDFLRDFRSCLLPEIVRKNTVETWHPISLYRSSNAKITSDVLRAS
jgi:hypothetical protein